MPLPKKKRVLSAIQPSGELHIGNYLGAMRQWVALQDAGNTCAFPVVDLHAITVSYDPKRLPETVLRTAATLFAVGIDPKKSLVFVQSHISAHAEAAWLLTTITPVGELERMTQYKDKATKQKTVGAGLLNYPTLMAADILLYDTQLVPVGDDQLQHIEFTRTVARKFNRTFGNVFTEPDAYLVKSVARIMSLTDPKRKMSKSDAPASSVALLDSPVVIQKKIRAAVTDSGTSVNPVKLGPALKNLLTIYATLGSDPIVEKGSDPLSMVAEQFAGKGYAEFKAALADLIVDTLAPIQTRVRDLLDDPAELYRTLARGAERAAPIAYGTLARMKEHMGLRLKR